MGYRIWLKFNLYTGDFENELTAFLFGVQDKGDIDYQEFVDNFSENADRHLLSLKEKLKFTKYTYNNVSFERCVYSEPYPLGTKYNCDGIYFTLKEQPTKHEMLSFLNRAEEFSKFYNEHNIIPFKHLECRGFMMDKEQPHEKEDEGK